MPADALVAFEPRKTPIQARSTVTVEAISEATIQVLLSHGAERLTTTRVAERAGVSVGTLYQYYPNKRSLLFAVLENHLTTLAARVEATCESACHRPLAEMVKEMVEAFVDAKMERADISAALYRVSADVDGPTLIRRISQRTRKAVETMLETAPDTKSPPDKFAIDIMLSAMAGAMQSLLEAGPSPEEAVDHFGWIGPFFGMDLPASSAQTRERLGWSRPSEHRSIRPSFTQG